MREAPETTHAHEREPAIEEHIHLPQPTIWPVVMALGITLLAAGLALGVLVSIGGLALFAWSVYGWINDLMAEQETVTEEDTVTPDMERDERG